MKRFATITTCLVLSICLSSLVPTGSSRALHETKPAGASDSTVSRPAKTIRRQLEEDIKNLAGAPRFTPEEYARAVNYVKAQAKEVGLDADAAWFDVRNPWERGESDRCELLSTIGPATPLQIVALTNSPGARDVIGEVVLVNYFFDKNQGPPPHDFKDRIVLFSRPLQRDRTVKGYVDAVVQRNHGASWAARYGAKAVLVRSVQTDDNKTPHAGAVSYRDDRERIPAAALSIADADKVEGLLSDGKSSVSVRLNITPKHEPRKQANVLIRIPGSTLPEETVLVGAHLDSHDITPGAADDAAGVASVLAVMREFSRNPPERTIWLVLFADEEINSSGAIEFAQKYKAELSKPFQFVAAIEIDDGDGPPWALQITSPAERDKIKTALGSLRRIADRVGYEADGLELHTDPSANGADMEPLWDHYGIPEIAILQDLTKYFDKHHAQTDRPENIDGAGLEQTTRLLIRIIQVIASADSAEMKSLRGVPNDASTR